ADSDRARGAWRHHLRYVARNDAAFVAQMAVAAGHGLREPDAIDSIAARHLLVLLPGSVHRRVDHWIADADPGRRRRVVGDHVHAVRSGVLLGNHARRHSIDTAR